MADFDQALASAAEGALADIQASAPAPAPAAPLPATAVADQVGAVTPPADPATPAPEASAPPQTPPSDTQTLTPDTPAPADQATAVQKWVFERKGQQVEVTDPSKALEYMRQGYDYTTKTMELSEARKAFEAQRAQLAQDLEDEAKIEAHLAYLRARRGQSPTQTPAQTPSTPQQDPTELVDHQTAQALLARQQQAILAQTQTAAQQIVQAELLKAETARYTEEYTTVVNQTLQTLIHDKYKDLLLVDKVDKLIMDDVAETIRARYLEDPSKVADIKEVQTLMAKAAEARATKLSAALREHRKMEAVRAAKLTAPEGPGGTQTPAATPDTPNLKLGDPRLTELAIQDVLAGMRRS